MSATQENFRALIYFFPFLAVLDDMSSFTPNRFQLGLEVRLRDD